MADLPNKNPFFAAHQLAPSLRGALALSFERDPLQRLLQTFLGGSSPATWEVTMSRKRVAVIWRHFAEYLRGQGWERAGDLGWHRTQSPVPPSDQILLGSGDPPLTYPTDRVIFLERGAELKCVQT